MSINGNGYHSVYYNLSPNAHVSVPFIHEQTYRCGTTDSHVGQLVIYLGGDTGSVTITAPVEVLRAIGERTLETVQMLEDAMGLEVTA